MWILKKEALLYAWPRFKYKMKRKFLSSSFRHSSGWSVL